MKNFYDPREREREKKLKVEGKFQVAAFHKAPQKVPKCFSLGSRISDPTSATSEPAEPNCGPTEMLWRCWRLMAAPFEEKKAGKSNKALPSSMLSSIGTSCFVRDPWMCDD